MKLNDCDTLRILESKQAITKMDMKTLVYAADSKEDFLVQNYVQRQVLIIHGNDFVEKSQNMIETILYFIAKKQDTELYTMYKKSFNKFMESVDNDYDEIISFNIIFIFYISIARRLLRQSADKYA